MLHDIILYISVGR